MPSEAIIEQDDASGKERTSRFVKRVGFPRITSDVLSLCPYLPLEDAD